MAEKLLIALDVGGTKADAVLFKENGEIIAHLVEPGGIPFDFGVEKSTSALLSTLNRLLSYANAPVDSMYCAIATVEYYYDEFCQFFDDYFSNRVKSIRIEGDGVSLISGKLGHHDGASMICGTGSALYIRRGDSYRHLGGGGHLIDSCGSGYTLGRYALQAAMRAADGSATPTLICDFLRNKYGKDVWADLVTVYKYGRSYVASFAESVFEARKQGDCVARGIFNRCAADMADVVWAAYAEMGNKPFDIILNGGIFRNYPEYAAAVIAASPSDVKFTVSDTPPIVGCAIEAMYDIGYVECPEAVKEIFLDQYYSTLPKKN